MKNQLFFILLLISLSCSSKSFGKLMDSDIFSSEFASYVDFQDYKKFNESINVDDYTFCEFDRGEELCLLGLSKQKYAIDFKNFDARKIIYEVDFQGAFQPIRLESLNEMEERVLIFFAKYINKSVTDLRFSFPIISTNINFQLHSNLKSAVNQSYLSGDIPNGCGSPEHESYPYIPDKPFLRACNNHDLCYSSFRNKSWCDSTFLSDMRFLARREAKMIAIDFPVPESIALGALMSMAYVYHKAVENTEAALNAYCANKGTSCKDKRGELNVVNAVGKVVAGSGDGGSGDIFPRELYNGGICLIPIQYSTCAYGVCVRDIMYLPCP